MPNYASLADFICLILKKADYKLLKQQLFNNFWQYFSIGASLLNFFRIFWISYWNLKEFKCICILCIVINLKKFLIEIRLTCANFTWIQSNSRSNHRCDLADLPWNLNFASLLFLFKATNFKYFRLIMTTCANNTYSVSICFMLFLHQVVY